MWKGQTLLVLGLVIAVLIILGRIIWGSPLVKHVREGFANASTPINTMTECPPGSTMYMYNGVAYCCGGMISIDADSAADTCRPATSAPGAPPPLFCTLGAATDGVPNCVETRTGIIQAIGEQTCPTEIPNLVMGRDHTVKCCAGMPNADSSDCANPAETSCSVTSNPKWLTEPDSCQWIKFHEENKSCSPDMTEVIAAGHGPIEGTAVFGCLNQSAGQFCYSKALVAQLKSMGYDASGLNVCSSSG